MRVVFLWLLLLPGITSVSYTRDAHAQRRLTERTLTAQPWAFSLRLEAHSELPSWPLDALFSFIDRAVREADVTFHFYDDGTYRISTDGNPVDIGRGSDWGYWSIEDRRRLVLEEEHDYDRGTDEDSFLLDDAGALIKAEYVDGAWQPKPYVTLIPIR
jgi:hypothetical protein